MAIVVSMPAGQFVAIVLGTALASALVVLAGLAVYGFKRKTAHKQGRWPI